MEDQFKDSTLQEAPNASAVTPIINPLPVSEKKSFFARLFSTKTSTFGVLVLIVLVFNSIASQFFSYSPFPQFSSIIIIIIIGLLLRFTGHKQESSNVFKVLGRIALVVVGLLVIGFGVCLLIIGGWN